MPRPAARARLPTGRRAGKVRPEMDAPRISSPSGEGSAPRQIALVGINRETAALLPGLLEAEGIEVVRILNPDLEDPSRLTQFPNLAVIIDTTGSESVAVRLRRLPLKKAEIITGMGARILFCSLRGGRWEGKAPSANLVRCMEEVREAITGSRGRGETLRAILNSAVKAARADSGSLMLLDATRSQLTIEAAFGLEEKVVLSAVQKVGHGVSGTAIHKGETLIINGPADRQAFSADYENPGIVSSICCPLLLGAECLGVLNIASRDPARIFDRGDAAFLEELGRLTAEVIQSGRDGEGGSHAHAHSHGGQAPGLMHSAQEILAMPYRLEERINLLLMKLANAFGANLCSYYEYSAEDGVFVARSTSAAGSNLPKEKPKFLDDFFAQRVLKTDHGFCVNAAGKGPRDKKWYLLQPVRSGPDLIGTLFVHLHSEKNALKEEASLLRKVGELLSREVARNREMEAVKVRSLKFSAVSQFAFDAGAAASLEEMGRMLLANMGAILEAETCVLRLRESEAGELRVFDTLSGKNPAWLKDILAMDERIVSDFSEGGQVVLFPDLRESPYSVDLLGSESALAASLRIDGAFLGSISLYDRKAADLGGTPAFDEADREVILAFARAAAKALQRFRPFPAPDSWSPAAPEAEAAAPEPEGDAAAPALESAPEAEAGGAQAGD